MNLFRLNIALACLLVLLLAGAWALRRNPGQRNLEILPDMQYSPAYHAYEPNPYFTNGQTLRRQPDGTIAQGELPLHADNQIIPEYAATPEDAARAGEELTNPLDSSAPEVLQRGEETYGIFCAICHGTAGLGKGPVTKRGYPPVPSLLTGNSAQMKDGQLFHILTYGQGSMKPYASQITPVDRWRVIAYVRDMQAKAAEAAGEAEPANAADAVDGPPVDTPPDDTPPVETPPDDADADETPADSDQPPATDPQEGEDEE